MVKIPTAKLVLLGESSVGKSSILSKYGTNTFDEGKEATIGAAYMARVCSTAKYDIKLEIWDTAGQERFQSITPMYYRNALAAIVVYDLTNANSFEKAKECVYELRRDRDPEVVITLVGNKADLLDHAERAVPLNDVESLVKEFSLFQYFETSAFYGTGIVQLFTEIANKISLGNIKYPSDKPDLDNESKPDTHCAC